MMNVIDCGNDSDGGGGNDDSIVKKTLVRLLNYL